MPCRRDSCGMVLLKKESIQLLYNQVFIYVQVSIASPSVSTDSTQDSTANLSDAIVYAFLANQPNGSQLVHEDLEQIHEDNLEEMNLKWQLALLSMRARRECRSPRNQESRLRINEMGPETKSSRGLERWKKLLPKQWWLLMELVLIGAIWQKRK
ncbi:hypothetical protein Tco_0962474 [Tanacetum coccineum]